MEKTSTQMKATRVIKGKSYPFDSKNVTSALSIKHYLIQANLTEQGSASSITLAFPAERLKQGEKLDIGRGPTADVRANLTYAPQSVWHWASEGNITITAWNGSTKQLEASFWFKTTLADAEVTEGKVALQLSNKVDALSEIEQQLNKKPSPTT